MNHEREEALQRDIPSLMTRAAQAKADTKTLGVKQCLAQNIQMAERDKISGNHG